MSDKWDAYVVDDKEDKWSQYEVKNQDKPTVWSKLGAEITPEMTARNPILSGIAKTGQDVATIPAHFFNQLALNLPRAAVNRMGATYPETTNPVANLAAKGAGIAGMVTSPVGKAIQGLGKIAKGASVGSKVLKAAKVGAISGAAYTPTEDIIGVPQRIAQGIGGAALGSLSMVATNFPKLVNFGGRKTAQAIAEKADKGIDKLSQGLSDKYDELFSNIKAKVPTKDIAIDIQNTIDEFPEGANVGKLKSILNRVQGTKEKPIKEISAKELFNIKKEISKTIPKSVWNGVSDADAITNSKEGLYWKLTKKLEEIGGEKYSGLTDEYRGFKQAERLARKMFYKQGIPSNLPLGGNMDIPTQRAINKLSSQLPDEEMFAQQFEAWRRGQATKKVGSKIIGGTLLGYGAYEGMKRLFPKE